MCYVALARPLVGNADTYYFPERRYPFNRIIEQKRFGDAMLPAERTVLGGDIACDPGEAVYQASDPELADLVLPALEEAGLVRREQVVEVFSRRLPAAYPLYDLEYEAPLARAQAWLSRLENLWLIGRQGLYLHNNTHHSLLMGYRAADAITSGGRAGWPATLDEFAAFRVAD
jgi:protoporphyrinogen oxidase